MSKGALRWRTRDINPYLQALRLGAIGTAIVTVLLLACLAGGFAARGPSAR